LHRDPDPVERWLRDRAGDHLEEIWVDSPTLERSIVETLEALAPDLVSRVRRYDGGRTLFDAFGLGRQLATLWRHRLPLPAGGSLVIEPTEALVAIDVNSGRDVAGSSLEATALATNLEAAVEAARQIRLRDLAGILVIDFIDMAEAESWALVLAALGDELAKDRAATMVEGPLAFGLVALTRKRGRNDLLRRLSVECRECSGAGRVPSPAEILGEARRELLDRETSRPGRAWRLRLGPAAAGDLDGAVRDELEQRLGGSLRVETVADLGAPGYELDEDRA
jgi:ribonuclease G